MCRLGGVTQPRLTMPCADHMGVLCTEISARQFVRAPRSLHASSCGTRLLWAGGSRGNPSQKSKKTGRRGKEGQVRKLVTLEDLWGMTHT